MGKNREKIKGERIIGRVERGDEEVEGKKRKQDEKSKKKTH